MARIITNCAGTCRQSTTGNVTDEQLTAFISGGPLNKGPFFKFDRQELHTLTCHACGGPVEVTLTPDGAEWLAYKRGN